MNISNQIFPTDGSNISYHESLAANVVIVLLGFPINSYVIWLIVTGTGNGLAAELFSLNLSICEILFCSQSLLSLIIYETEDILKAWSFVSAVTVMGRPLFQSLICVERYLAVVQPMIFLKSKPLRYRLICCVCVWMTTLVSGGIMFLTMYSFLSGSFYIFIMVYFFLIFLIQLVCFVAVLRALKQPGPGDGKRERNENHMKRRAFYLILITTTSMFFVFLLYMILIISLFHVKDNVELFVCVTYSGFALAASVQPLLFLYRVEKPPFVMKCKLLWIRAARYWKK